MNNLHGLTASVISTSPPGQHKYVEPAPPPASSQLATVANSLSAGQWAELVTNNFAVNGVLFGGTSTLNILSDSNNGAWDPVHGLAHFVGQDHGMGGLRHIQYTESTNTWAAVADFGALGDSRGHGLNDLCCDSATGDLWFTLYDDGGLWKKPYGQQWIRSFRSFPDIDNITHGTVWWSGSFSGLAGGSRAVISHEASTGGLWVYDTVGDTYTKTTPFPLWAPGYNNVAAYNPNANYAMMGGGNNHGQNVFRLNADKSLTTLNDLPSAIAVSIRDGTLCHNPKPGANTFLSIARDGHIWEFDISSTGTYTQQGTIPAAVNPPSQGLSSNMVVVIAVPTYGVMMALSADSGSSGNVYLYKPL